MSTPESPAQVIRRAAELMRERVAELPPSPWRAEGRDVTATQDYERDGSWDWGRGYVIAACPRQDEAEHIAAWSPPVALAVADLLDSEARAYDAQGYGRFGRAFCALKVARDFLGEDHPVPVSGGKDSSDKEND